MVYKINMKTLTFDIETIPADKKQTEKLTKLYTSKKNKIKNLDDLKEFGTLDDFLRRTSLDGSFGRILCIGYALNEEEPKIICNIYNEKKNLEDFWDLCIGVDKFVGHNILDFDLKFIYHRSIILGVKPTRSISFARYVVNGQVYDTIQEWSKWSFSDKKSLEHLALAMDIPSPKEEIDGTMVADFYKDGKIDEICNYCMKDVVTTREIYKRMNFSE